MNLTQLEFQTEQRGKTQNEKLRAILESNPGVWLSMLDLGRQIGAWAVHSRIADLRTKFGMHIEHQSRRADGGKKHSFYRYVPDEQSINSQ